MVHTTPQDAASTNRTDPVAWPRGLQIFALVAFMTNLGVVVYLVS